MNTCIISKNVFNFGSFRQFFTFFHALGCNLSYIILCKDKVLLIALLKRKIQSFICLFFFKNFFCFFRCLSDDILHQSLTFTTLSHLALLLLLLGLCAKNNDTACHYDTQKTGYQHFCPHWEFSCLTAFLFYLNTLYFCTIQFT